MDASSVSAMVNVRGVFDNACAYDYVREMVHAKCAWRAGAVRYGGAARARREATAGVQSAFERTLFGRGYTQPRAYNYPRPPSLVRRRAPSNDGGRPTGR
ncbi:hypothetical protein EON67_07240 [archaeon]|nr:MAG: hypothetical protein EON67_07240 [archaeon]